MKTIIAGSRKIKDFAHVETAMANCPWRDQITHVVSGCAPGVDTLGEEWAEKNLIHIVRAPAKWDDLTAPGAVVKRHNISGKPYNARAGFDRNEAMAKYADALVAVWNGHSHGTADMIQRAERHGLKIYKHKVTT